MERLYKASEMAKMLGITHQHFNKLVREGIIPRRADKKYDESAIHAYLKSLRQAVAFHSGKTRGKPGSIVKKVFPQPVVHTEAAWEELKKTLQTMFASKTKNKRS